METARVEVFYDGDCPLCVREINMLRRLDKKRGRIRFTDIAAPGFDAAEHGRTYDDFMARIQGRRREDDGSVTWIEGVEVFRALYAAVGAGPLVSLSRLPGVRQALDVAYVTFAKNRLRWTGRDGCEDGVCSAPSTASQRAA